MFSYRWDYICRINIKFFEFLSMKCENALSCTSDVNEFSGNLKLTRI